MTTPPLPPEIKSAEEHVDELVTLSNSRHVIIDFEDSVLKTTKQRDLAIWNAAIEKAAETLQQGFTGCKIGTIGATKDAAIEEQLPRILNFKRKE